MSRSQKLILSGVNAVNHGAAEKPAAKTRQRISK
jgi:hypothetical protein